MIGIVFFPPFPSWYVGNLRIRSTLTVCLNFSYDRLHKLSTKESVMFTAEYWQQMTAMTIQWRDWEQNIIIVLSCNWAVVVANKQNSLFSNSLFAREYYVKRHEVVRIWYSSNTAWSSRHVLVIYAQLCLHEVTCTNIEVLQHYYNK